MVTSREPPALVIVEGTCGSGKTTLVRAAHTMFADRDVRMLLQRATYAPIAAREDAGTLDDVTNRDALREIVTRIRDDLAGPKCLVLVDTLHATHFVRAGALSLASFSEIDRELHELDPLVVVLRVSETSIRARTIVGRRGTGFYEYARKFGVSEDDRTLYFMREQVRLLDLLRMHSRLRQVVLDGDAPVASVQARFHRAVHDYLGRGT